MSESYLVTKVHIAGYGKVNSKCRAPDISVVFSTNRIAHEKNNLYIFGKIIIFRGRDC